jgi:serine/threonine protein kinase
MDNKAHRNSLPSGCQLHWFRIENVLGQGGFGLTYLARDVNLDRLVAIKEYLPTQICMREADQS